MAERPLPDLEKAVIPRQTGQSEEGRVGESLATFRRHPAAGDQRAAACVRRLVRYNEAMASTLVAVEEYLSTSYPDGDREYVDGQIVERNLGEIEHASLQTRIVFYLLSVSVR
jgi:hypothetical protein